MSITYQIYPSFPLPDPPACRSCGCVSKYPNIVQSEINGNLGRPYARIPCGRWIAWDDDRGLRRDNPHCGCGMSSQRDREGHESSSPQGLERASGLVLLVRADITLSFSMGRHGRKLEFICHSKAARFSDLIADDGSRGKC